ncbi:nose resistant to fluoxetine protein 6-like [Centruroides sculpturatus]|uniref:nose resistant to fluoxetine protein 6-like n=1 Tax=Centruroides sculpturatus TaxID=218467 RepID=UPI000C6DEABD|nr:nose resistant to fluoxetine protein 6-like [Centruroides sculpturatus]
MDFKKFCVILTTVLSWFLVGATTTHSPGITLESLPVNRTAELTSSKKFNNNKPSISNENEHFGIKKENNKPEEEEDPEKELIDFLNSMKGFIRDMSDKALKQLLPIFMSMSSELKLSNNCTFAFLQVVRGLREFRPWTMKLIDANSKIPEGILYGSMSTFGSYDECLSVVVDEEDPNSMKGQYCSINISPYLPPRPRQYTFDSAFQEYPVLKKKLHEMHMSDLMPSYYFIQHRFGLCLPSSCSRKDVEEMTSLASHHMKINVSVVHCEIKTELTLSKGQIITGSLILSVTIFIALVTMLDVIPRIYSSIFKTKTLKNKEEKQSALRRFTEACSFYSNIKYILTTETSTNSLRPLHGALRRFTEACSFYSNIKYILTTETSTNSLRPLHGIRFISCTWIILGHTYYCKNYIEIGALRRFTEACSFYSNIKYILTTETSTNSLRPLHGIRFISCTWIILGHTYYCKNYIEIAALSKVKELGYGIMFQVVLNAGFAADTFFFLSGLLVVYTTLQKMQECNGRFNIIYFYFRRYWRLTPAFMLATGLIIMGPIYGSGPIWQETLKPFVDGCEKNWWTNLLYISNIIKTSESCVPHGWYISCDMQFYLLSPLIFLTLYKKPSLGKLLIAGGIVLSMAIVGTLTLFFKQPPVSLFSIPDPRDVNDFLDTVGYKPYTHFASYCIGMAAGYLLVTHNKLTIKTICQILGWAVSIILSVTIVYGTLMWNSGYMPSLPITLLYAATCRPIWTLCIAWVTIICITGHGGIINEILSWKCFVPLSRLCYLAYLLHPLMMYLYVSYARSPIHFSQYVMVYMFLGHLCVTFGLAFVYTLIFEAPFVRLEKLFIQKFADKWGHSEGDQTEMKDTVIVKSMKDI